MGSLLDPLNAVAKELMLQSDTITVVGYPWIYPDNQEVEFALSAISQMGDEEMSFSDIGVQVMAATTDAYAQLSGARPFSHKPAVRVLFPHGWVRCQKKLERYWTIDDATVQHSTPQAELLRRVLKECGSKVVELMEQVRQTSTGRMRLGYPLQHALMIPREKNR